MQVIGLILYLVSIMAGLLVECQEESIAILRSRGASNWQIIGSLITQGIGLGLLALVVGPLLAMLAVYVIVRALLSSLDQGALAVISSAPAQTFLSVMGYAILALVVAMIAMSLALYRASHLNVLSLRREAARSTQRPLWQRLNLDLIAAVIALSGYAVAVYLTNVGGLLTIET